MSDAEEVVRAFHAAFEERDEQRFAEIVADDVEFVNPLGAVVARGRAGALEWLRKNDETGVHVTFAGEPDVSGDHVEWRATMLIAASGAEVPATGVFDVRDGRIVRFEARTGPR